MSKKTEEQTNQLWDMAKNHGMDRRRFVKLLGTGGAAAVVAGVTDTPLPEVPARQDPPLHFKDTEGFIAFSKNLETRLENLNGFITPKEKFFVRNNSRSYDIDSESYRLVVTGDAVENEIELSLADLKAMQSHTMMAYVECGGNQRSMFEKVMGQPASGGQWATGGISQGEWTGVRLADVLALAGVKDNAVDVLLVGLDDESPEEGFRRAMPLEKALDAHTMLAYGMNGGDLPKDHGAPVRGIVPGWVGSSNIKWLGRIEVSSEKFWTKNNTTSYVKVGEDFPPESEESNGVAVYEQSIKSALRLPWPAELSAGSQMVRGYAHSPAKIAKVEWSADGGATWQEATLTGPVLPYSWAQFEFEWDASAGDHTIMTRATDEAGNTQPDEIPFNEKGYLFNLPLPHPITVS